VELILYIKPVNLTPDNNCQIKSEAVHIIKAGLALPASLRELKQQLYVSVIRVICG
jgi:hypothetical protein